MPGIQRTEQRTSTDMSTNAQVGQLRRSVVPSDAIQASYPLPSFTICHTLATNIEIIAIGDRYFQQISQ